MRELEASRRDLELRVAERTRELSLVKARLETALRGAYVHAFSQDRDLRYTWVYDPDGPDAAAEMLGRTDEDILPACSRDAVVAAKRRVIETGRSETCEVSSVSPRARALFALHIEPAYGPDGRIEGLTGAAIDISRLRSLESEQQRLADELRTALRRYEIALRGSHVTLFTQDRDLRFTSISNPLFGREVDDIVGRADADILPAESRAQFGALAREAIASGRAQGGEVSVKEADKTRWYDLHVEPLPGENGEVAGVTCALFDITDRKTGESHLRLLMRELTHRSKNLLAVIQSMARQTARHAGSIDDFLDAFGARLQAIATSHDLLVQEGWYGASLQDLTRRQLEKYIDGAAARVKLSGPSVRLKPAAAQSFGLALHELAMNAERFGALSVPQGRVEVVWSLQTVEGSEQGVEIIWVEHDGPDVTAPISRGFGSLVVEKNLSRALDADVALTFEPTGVRCRMLIPASHLLASR
jgi:PAS domain S-box-containing protein